MPAEGSVVTTAVGQGVAIRTAGPGDVDPVRSLMLRYLDDELGHGYVPVWHWDLDDLHGVYLDHPRHQLFVAVDDAAGELAGVAAVRAGGPNSPPHPRWVAERYDPVRTAHLCRVYITPHHRRRDIARRLVETARQFVASEGGYEVIYLHSDGLGKGAEEFWQRLPTTLVHDGRTRREETDAVHFELSLIHPVC